MNKRDILKKSKVICERVGNLTDSLTKGYESLTNSQGEYSLLSVEEYRTLKQKFQEVKPVESPKQADVNREITQKLREILMYTDHAPGVLNAILHEAESRRREDKQRFYEAQEKLKEAQEDICYLQRKLSRYERE
tara:strand:+ start:273 stop:677 length:405 start_codon:yes stop_codon:yes gene_type:complete